jgi:hypothetical protein
MVDLAMRPGLGLSDDWRKLFFPGSTHFVVVSTRKAVPSYLTAQSDYGDEVVRALNVTAWWFA